MLTSTQQATLDYHLRLPPSITTFDYHLRETNLLTNEALILELTDHYTTALLERMAQGMTFEGALTATQQAFGGRKGLQKMERQYNQVTFRQYDERWKQALVSQFQKPLLWRQTMPAYAVMFFGSLLILTQDPIKDPQWTSFTQGIWQGLLGGILIGPFGLLWPYLKAIFQHGLHNVPVQVLYLVKRQTLLTSLQCLLGIGGYFWLMPLLPSALQAFLMSLFVAGMCLYMLTAHYMRELLYVYEESR
ncbi:hypothetical protein [Spirosoma linguale]|uniref:Uncharacterized protein n=1 Tax=Spirosoma linguale (strain ATCC 33905 / DSM 74 / LMG 10896 / Claus 1) TaxID=504472 RepID=D2QUI3_SPILD|nr:hypothetical protein Slin_6508 [Spirosoma linguale DSM 74]